MKNLSIQRKLQARILPIPCCTKHLFLVFIQISAVFSDKFYFQASNSQIFNKIYFSVIFNKVFVNIFDFSGEF